MGLVHETKKDWLSTIIKPGADPGFTKGRTQIQYSEHDNHVRSTFWHAKHAKSWGSGMPPENIKKLNPLRLNLRAFLMGYCLYYSKTAHC